MKALMLKGIGDLALMDVPVAPVGPRDVKIRVAECGLCGTDHSVYAGTLVLPGDFPFYMGHELSGIVEQVGDRREGYRGRASWSSPTRSATAATATDAATASSTTASGSLSSGGPTGAFPSSSWPTASRSSPYPTG